MSDRYHSLTVVLADDLRKEELEGIIRSICIFKGVLHVTPNAVDIESYVAYQRARHELEDKLWSALEEEPAKQQ